jgi:hypothetical protein
MIRKNKKKKTGKRNNRFSELQETAAGDTDNLAV